MTTPAETAPIAIVFRSRPRINKLITFINPDNKRVRTERLHLDPQTAHIIRIRPMPSNRIRGIRYRLEIVSGRRVRGARTLLEGRTQSVDPSEVRSGTGGQVQSA